MLCQLVQCSALSVERVGETLKEVLKGSCRVDTLQHLSSIGSKGKESAFSAREVALIPGLGRSPGEGTGYSHQYSCLENSMDRGAGGLRPMGHKESDTTEQLTLSLYLVY